MNVKGLPRSLSTLLGTVQDKKYYVEQLERLKKMVGRFGDSPGKIKCDSVHFESAYTASAYTRTEAEYELNNKLLQTAIEYYTDKLSTIDLLIGLADKAAEKLLKECVADQVSNLEATQSDQSK